MESDKKPIGRRSNTFKKDFSLYIGGGVGGVPSASQAGKTRHTFWIDHNRFASLIRKILARNVSFEIYGSATDIGGGVYVGDAGTEKSVYLFAAQSNDAPDETIRSDGTLVSGGATPYDIDITITKQPKDKEFVHDQGKYVVNAYSGYGLGLGNSNKIVESFVPQSPLITGIWLKRLFRSGDLTDVNKYHNIIVEIWDKNKNTIASMTIAKEAGQLNPEDYKTEYYQNVGGTNYWIDLDEVRVRPKDGSGNLSPVEVEVGQTHYICIKQDTSTVAHDYAVGSNTGSDGVYNGNGRYIYGAAYTAPYASTTLTAVGTDIDICFTTTRNQGRMAVTFLWDLDTYWWYNPESYKDGFKFIKEDFEEVI